MSNRDPVSVLKRALAEHDAEAARLFRQAAQSTAAATALATVLAQMQAPVRPLKPR